MFCNTNECHAELGFLQADPAQIIVHAHGWIHQLTSMDGCVHFVAFNNFHTVLPLLLIYHIAHYTSSSRSLIPP